jgi:hypothetical protein
VSVKLGFVVNNKDFIIELAKRLQEQDSHKKEE